MKHRSSVPNDLSLSLSWHFTPPTNRLHATLTCASTSAANMLSWATLLLLYHLCP